MFHLLYTNYYSFSYADNIKSDNIKDILKEINKRDFKKYHLNINCCIVDNIDDLIVDLRNIFVLPLKLSIIFYNYDPYETVFIREELVPKNFKISKIILIGNINFMNDRFINSEGKCSELSWFVNSFYWPKFLVRDDIIVYFNKNTIIPQDIYFPNEFPKLAKLSVLEDKEKIVKTILGQILPESKQKSARK